MKLIPRNFLFTALVSLGLVGCASDGATSSTGSHQHGAGAYPLTTCVVSGEKLGAMGKPVVVTVKDHTFQLCCSGCEKKLRENPDKYIEKLEQAEKGNTPAGEGHQH